MVVTSQACGRSVDVVVTLLLHLSMLKNSEALRSLGICTPRPYRCGMITLLSALVSLLSFLVRSRAHLELELIALRLSGERAAAPAARSASALLHRSAPLDMALSDLAAGPQCLGAGQASNRGPVASQRLPALLAVAITPSGTAQDEHRNPRSDPSDETPQPALGRAPHPRRTAQARHRGQSGHSRVVCWTAGLAYSLSTAQWKAGRHQSLRQRPST
jgi:hypothetical protein